MRRAVILAVAAVVVTVSSAFAADFGGVWKGEVKLPTGQALPFVARLTQNGNTITGTLDAIAGGSGDRTDVVIHNGKVENETVTFSGVRTINDMPVEFRYTARFTGPTTLHFDIVRADGKQAPLESVTKREN